VWLRFGTRTSWTVRRFSPTSWCIAAPNARLHPGSNAANQAQTAAWEKACPSQGNLAVVRRPLKCPSEFPKRRPQEKGVEVARAIGLVQLTYQGPIQLAHDITRPSLTLGVSMSLRFRSGDTTGRPTGSPPARTGSPRTKPIQNGDDEPPGHATTRTRSANASVPSMASRHQSSLRSDR